MPETATAPPAPPSWRELVTSKSFTGLPDEDSRLKVIDYWINDNDSRDLSDTGIDDDERVRRYAERRISRDQVMANLGTPSAGTLEDRIAASYKPAVEKLVGDKPDPDLSGWLRDPAGRQAAVVDGAILVHPSVEDPEDYRKAVMATGERSTPEAKLRALAVRDQMRNTLLAHQFNEAMKEASSLGVDRFGAANLQKIGLEVNEEESGDGVVAVRYKDGKRPGLADMTVSDMLREGRKAVVGVAGTAQENAMKLAYTPPPLVAAGMVRDAMEGARDAAGPTKEELAATQAVTRIAQRTGLKPRQALDAYRSFLDYAAWHPDDKEPLRLTEVPGGTAVAVNPSMLFGKENADKVRAAINNADLPDERKEAELARFDEARAAAAPRALASYLEAGTRDLGRDKWWKGWSLGKGIATAYNIAGGAVEAVTGAEIETPNEANPLVWMAKEGGKLDGDVARMDALKDHLGNLPSTVKALTFLRNAETAASSAFIQQLASIPQALTLNTIKPLKEWGKEQVRDEEARRMLMGEQLGGGTLGTAATIGLDLANLGGQIAATMLAAKGGAAAGRAGAVLEASGRGMTGSTAAAALRTGVSTGADVLKRAARWEQLGAKAASYGSATTYSYAASYAQASVAYSAKRLPEIMAANPGMTEEDARVLADAEGDMAGQKEGLLNAAITFLTMKMIPGVEGKLAKDAADDASVLGRTTARGLFSAYGKDAVLKGFTDQTIRNQWGRFLKPFVGEVVAEGAQEGLEQIGNTVSQLLVRDEDMTVRDAVKSVIYAAFLGAFGGGMGAAPSIFGRGNELPPPAYKEPTGDGTAQPLTGQEGATPTGATPTGTTPTGTTTPPFPGRQGMDATPKGRAFTKEQLAVPEEKHDEADNAARLAIEQTEGVEAAEDFMAGRLLVKQARLAARDAEDMARVQEHIDAIDGAGTVAPPAATTDAGTVTGTPAPAEVVPEEVQSGSYERAATELARTLGALPSQEQIESQVEGAVPAEHRSLQPLAKAVAVARGVLKALPEARARALADASTAAARSVVEKTFAVRKKNLEATIRKAGGTKTLPPPTGPTKLDDGLDHHRLRAYKDFSGQGQSRRRISPRTGMETADNLRKNVSKEAGDAYEDEINRLWDEAAAARVAADGTGTPVQEQQGTPAPPAEGTVAPAEGTTGPTQPPAEGTVAPETPPVQPPAEGETEPATPTEEGTEGAGAPGRAGMFGFRHARRKATLDRLGVKDGDAGSLLGALEKLADANDMDTRGMLNSRNRWLARILLRVARKINLADTFTFEIVANREAAYAGLFQDGRIAINLDGEWVNTAVDLLHEILHGVTRNALRSDPKFRGRVRNLRKAFGKIADEGLTEDQALERIDRMGPDVTEADKEEARNNVRDYFYALGESVDTGNAERMAEEKDYADEFLAVLLGNDTLMGIAMEFTGKGERFSLARRLANNIASMLAGRDVAYGSITDLAVKELFDKRARDGNKDKRAGMLAYWTKEAVGKGNWRKPSGPRKQPVPPAAQESVAEPEAAGRERFNRESPDINYAPSRGFNFEGRQHVPFTSTVFRNRLGKLWGAAAPGDDEANYWASGWLFGQGGIDKRLVPAQQKLKAELNAVQKEAQLFDRAMHTLLKKHFGSDQAKWPMDRIRAAMGGTDRSLSEDEINQLKKAREEAYAAARDRYAERTRGLDAKGREDAPAILREELDAARKEADDAEKAMRRDKADKAREQADASMGALPVDIRDRVARMRGRIDMLSQLVADTLGADPGLSAMLGTEVPAREGLKRTIEENLGVYLNRSYRFFDDANYRDWILRQETPEAKRIFTEAVDWMEAHTVKRIARELQAAERTRQVDGIMAAEGLPREEARAMAMRTPNPLPMPDALVLARDKALAGNRAEVRYDVREYLKDKLSAHGAIGGSTTAARKPTGILARRKDIPQALRNLLGEYTDPVIESTHTLYKLAQFVHRHDFLAETARIGRASGFLVTDAERKTREGTEDWVPVVAEDEKSLAYSPLAGLYGPPLLRDAIKAQASPEMTEAQRMFFNLQAYSLATKTTLSWDSHVRNFFGNTLFLLAQGHGLRMLTAENQTFGRAARATMTDIFGRMGSMELEEYITRLTSLGVIGDNITPNLVRDIHERVREELKDPGATLSEKSCRSIAGALRSAYNKATDIYGASDDFWKVVAFESELDLLKKRNKADNARLQADPALRDRLEREAARRVTMTLPTYSRTPASIKWLRKHPVFATFITFPAEIVRVSLNTHRLAVEDMKAGHAIDGASRLASFYAAQATLTLFARVFLEAAAAMGGDDDEKDREPGAYDAMADAIRPVLPQWLKDSQIFVSRGKDGRVTVQDFGFLDPFNILKAPVVAAMGSLKEGDDWGEAVWKGFLALADPLVSEKPLAGAIIDVLRDKEVRGDGSRPTPLDSKVESFGGKLSYVVREALLPGATDQVIKTALGAYSTATGDSPTYKGREYQLGPELFSRLGFRSYTYDPLRLFARDAKSLKSAMNEDWGKRVGSYLYSADRISAGGMRERIATANENRRKVLQDVSRRINAMKVLGYKAPVIQATLTGAGGLAVDDVRQAARGVYETHYPSKQMQVRMREAGNRLRDRQDRLAMLREAIAPLPEIRPLFDK